MAEHLVIVESPAKAKTINRLLGGTYLVKASMGHVRDLPDNRLGVNIADCFRPEYVELDSRKKVIRELRNAAKGVQTVYLAPDPDREGEAIAWHLKAVLQDLVPEDRFYRVTYNEITPAAIRKAFESVGRIDPHRVNSQQARRVLDRLVGFKISKLVRRQVKGGSSAGRVQSVALRLVCEREDEIERFTPEEYWILGARVAKQVDPRDPFTIRLARINGEKAEIHSSEEAQRVRADLENRTLRVCDIKRRELRRRPMPPFITSSLQQAGARLCGFSPSRTMRVAQGLYEGVDFGEGPVGMITYMRTDSVAVASSAQAAAREVIASMFGPDYLPAKPPVYRSRGSAQQAHEAVRPTDPSRRPEQMSAVLEPDQLKLYRVIWQRFMASQMAPAVIAQRSAEVEAVPDRAGEGGSQSGAAEYLFRATASEVVFPGYLRAMGSAAPTTRRSSDAEDAPEDGEEIEALPPLEAGEALDLKEWMGEQKFTQPPPRYSEATLIKAMEENGIGRPSTYAQTLATLQNRKYVLREKRQLAPTPAGRDVNAYLTDRLDALFNVKFTARMEEDLDRIEEGRVDWVDMLSRFYAQFSEWVEGARATRADAGQVQNLLAALDGVRAWAPEVKRGKRVYSDQAFVASLKEQIAKGKALTDRQVSALRKLAWRYRDQVPDLVARSGEMGLDEMSRADREATLPPRDETKAKLELLARAEFAPPKTVGKRTFDDAAFVRSLTEQVETGKRLSERQVQSLDRLLKRYGPSLEGYEELVRNVPMDQAQTGEEAPREELDLLFGAFDRISEWKPPVRKGKREWDDRKFFDSLREQYKTRHSLSPRQVAALRKMARRYRLESAAPVATEAPRTEEE